MCTVFCYTRNNKLRLKGGSDRLFLRLTNLQKQAHMFANKSIKKTKAIFFYLCPEFLMCTIPHFKEVCMVI